MKNRMVMMFAAVLAVSVTVQAAAYQEVLTAGQLNGGTSNNHQSAVVDGTTVYAVWTQGDGGAHIEAVDAVTAAARTVMPNLSWQIASGAGNVTPFYGLSIIGDDITFSDVGTDSVWKVNKNTGAITQYVSAAQIRTYTGQSKTSLLSPATAGFDGAFYFYEGESDSVLRTNGTGLVQTFISDTQLTAVAGNDGIGGGITFVDHDRMIWGNTTTDSLYLWDAAGQTGKSLLSLSEISAVTGKSTAGFGDIYYAEDGLVYFYESISDSILSFDADDAANTLAFVLTEAQLLAGPAASDSVGTLTWYDGNIAWTSVTPSVNGFYAVPEPVTLALLGFGGLGLLKRRRLRS